MSTCVLYEVTAVLRDEVVARDWVRWILDVHIAEVVEAGATSGRLLQIDDTPHTYVVQYEFASRDSLETYLLRHARRLREAGALRFGPIDVTYSRRTAAIVHH